MSQGQNKQLARAQAFLHEALDHPRRAAGAARVVSAALMVLIVANALLVFVVFDDRVSQTAHAWLYVFDAVSTAVFLVEYLARIWTAPLTHPTLSPARARLRYVLSPLGIVDLLAVLPFLFVAAGVVSYQMLNTFRVLRVIRLLKISRYLHGLDILGRVLHHRRRELVPAFTVLFLLIITSSALMYQAEHDVQPDRFDSVLAGMYWAISTITSTGYGDLVPVTPAGRLVGFLTMLLSIAIVAIPASIFTAGFIEELQEEREEHRHDEERDEDD